MIEGQAIVPAFDRYRFRGEFLDCFASIENHSAPALKRLVELGQAKKAPHLFGQKFDLILKAANLERLWLHRQHVSEILEALRPFAELRGLICHAIIESAVVGGLPAIALKPPGNNDWQARKLLTEDEAASLLAELRRLTAKLLKQGLVANAIPPSSTPPPLQVEAAGP